MATPNEIAARMVQSLRVSEPELDTGVGTPIRKILDTVAEAVSETTVDQFLTTYQYDIDTRSGADLDAFASLFGFYRLQAKRSSGTVLLQRTTPAPQSITIPKGAQASTSSASPVLVQTLVTAVFPRGDVVLEIPVQSVEGGSRGDLAAGQVTRWLTAIEGITSITNPAPMTGGADAETDEQFRDRLKRTIFRNLAGTKDMYLALGLAEPNTLNAEVYGPYERWIERIEIVDGVGSPSIATPSSSRTFSAFVTSDGLIIADGVHYLQDGDYVFIWGTSGSGADSNYDGIHSVLIDGPTDPQYFFIVDADGNIDDSATLTGSLSFRAISRMKATTPASHAFGNDIDFNDIFPNTLYEVDWTVAPPVITILDPDTIPDGVYEFAFTYASQASRNHPFRTSGIISDRVDVWIDGETVETANVVGILDSNNIMSFASDLFSTGAVLRRDGTDPGTIPSLESLIHLPLPLSPVITIPDTISVGSNVLEEGVDYWIVDDVRDELGGSMESISGIVFETGDSFGETHLPVTENIVGSASGTTPVNVYIGGGNDYVAGQRVLIEGNSNPLLNGLWTIESPGATIELEGSVGGTHGGGSGGTVRLFHPVSIDYQFNAAPLNVQRNIEEWRLVGTDVLVHKARPLPLKLWIAVQLLPGYSLSSVQSPVEYAAREVMKLSGIGGILQISDLLSAFSQISGVDQVRFLSGNDYPTLTVDDMPSQNIDFTTAHDLSVGDFVDFKGVVGNTRANNQAWRVLNVDSSVRIEVYGDADESSYVSGGTATKSNYGIHIMSPDGTRTQRVIADFDQTPSRAIDLHANDNEHFILHSVEISVKAQNSWNV